MCFSPSHTIKLGVGLKVSWVHTFPCHCQEWLNRHLFKFVTFSNVYIAYIIRRGLLECFKGRGYIAYSNKLFGGLNIWTTLFPIPMSKILNSSFLTLLLIQCMLIIGAFGYADDLKLLTPTVQALHILTNICFEYAAKYDILFNGKKSLLMIYKCTKNCPPDPAITINDVQVPQVHEVIHLGHKLSDDIIRLTLLNVLKILIDSQIFVLQILSIPTLILEMPYFRIIALLFYGSQILPLFGNCMEDIYTAWRIAMRRVWRVPWRTHNNMLPHLAGMIDPELWFAKRCIKFISICMKSDNNTVKTISMMGVNG